ncbi:hypothetical protein NPIL_571941, partial [Nephila pilipes]
NHYV